MDTNFLRNNGVDLDGALELLGDMENYAILVHAMKGDSKYLGFTRLSELSLDHQLKSQENDIDYVNSHYDELMAEADKVMNIVKEYLGK